MTPEREKLAEQYAAGYDGTYIVQSELLKELLVELKTLRDDYARLREKVYPIITYLREGCPSCGAGTVVVELEVGSFYPVIAICFDFGHVWPIVRGTHAWKKFTELQK